MKITKSSTEQLPVTGKDEFYWDDALRGFGVKVTKGGKKNFVLQTRLNGETKRFTIGVFAEPWTPDQARQQALQMLAEVARGIDPTAVKKVRQNQPTIAELAKTYSDE
eukprot:gene20375-28847_t